jgi:hypothetical protein
MKLRVMEKDGINRFRDYIHSLKTGKEIDKPELNDEPFSTEFRPVTDFDESSTFNSKLELAEYIFDVFYDAGIERDYVLHNNGLWTWLAYIWFDQITNNRKKVLEFAKYLCSLDYSDYYRHLVAGPYMIYSIHKRENSKIFLNADIYRHTDLIEQIASRQSLISQTNIIEVFSNLYFDQNRQKAKSGAQSRKRPGNIRRFVKVFQQFELTYDLYDMSPDQILDLLPGEFDKWAK